MHQRITQNEQRVDRLTTDLCRAAKDFDLGLQHVFSSHLVLAGAGYVEHSVKQVLAEYSRRHGNRTIQNFVEKVVTNKNSLNCKKIKLIVDQFDPQWWPAIESATSLEEREAVDSLKTLRDEVAHGGRNGTGLSVVCDYYRKAKCFVCAMKSVVLKEDKL